MLYNRYSGVLLVRLLGVWKEQKDNPGQSIPVSGLAYYISPPLTLADLWKDPFHAVFYLVFILGKILRINHQYNPLTQTLEVNPLKPYSFSSLIYNSTLTYPTLS